MQATLLSLLALFSVLATAKLPTSTGNQPAEVPNSKITSGHSSLSKNERAWYQASVKGSRLNEVRRYSNKIKSNQKRYEAVGKKTGVPWFIIGALHYRESTLRFSRHLHEGSSLNARTRYVPKGRPKTGNPPFSWEYSAVDALQYDNFHKVKTWNVATMLDMMERYNGLGYRYKGILSPYLFGATTQQQKGKYVADGKFSYSTWDKQLGTVALIKDLETLGVVKFKSRGRISL